MTQVTQMAQMAQMVQMTWVSRVPHVMVWEAWVVGVVGGEKGVGPGTRARGVMRVAIQVDGRKMVRGRMSFDRCVSSDLQRWPSSLCRICCSMQPSTPRSRALS